MAFVSSSVKSYSSGVNADVPVPASAASGLICVVDLFVEWASGTVTPPAGFTLETSQTRTGTVTWIHYRYWKRLTGADSGSYSFGLSVSAASMMSSSLWSGRATSGSPFDTGGGVSVSAANTLTSQACPSLSLTPTVAASDVIGGAFSYASGMGAGQTPAGWTQGALHGDGVLMYYKANQAAASTGSVAPSGNDDWSHVLSSLPPAGGAASVARVPIRRPPGRFMILRGRR